MKKVINLKTAFFNSDVSEKSVSVFNVFQVLYAWNIENT
jgi:hypothetical protein